MVRSMIFLISERHEIASIACNTGPNITGSNSTALLQQFLMTLVYFPYFISNKANAPNTFAEHAHLLCFPPPSLLRYFFDRSLLAI